MATVYCVKLGREAEALDAPPLPGDIGQWLYEHVSKEAWQMWLEHQTMLINEKRLNVRDPQTQKYLMEQMEAFFTGEGADLPEGYTPPEQAQGK